MSRRVVISGLGPVSGLGIGMEPTWQAVVAGQSAVGPIEVFDATGFACNLGCEVKGLKIKQFVPKSYRKAMKVMVRDIELAVAASHLAAIDAGLVTKGTSLDQSPSYDSPRIGVHIGAGLVAADLNELTTALSQATGDHGSFDIHQWGTEGINHLTPLWLLKYLPNMLACHVTIIHDAQGPSNTITCGDTSSTLSVGESLRVIQRGAADMCFCGGTENKLNPMGFLRQLMTGRYNTTDNGNTATAVRPFCQSAAGCVVGEGGGIVILEAIETFEQRAASTTEDICPKPRVYAEIVGFGASQSVDLSSRNLQPDPAGRGIALALRSALREAEISPDQIDLIIPYGLGWPTGDQAEAAALQSIFGETLHDLPIASLKGYAGNCCAGAGGLDVCVAAKAMAEQTIPAIINCECPLSGLAASSTASRPSRLRHAMVYSSGMGGQNAALVLKRVTV